jgi:hypothetical protein
VSQAGPAAPAAGSGARASVAPEVAAGNSAGHSVEGEGAAAAAPAASSEVDEKEGDGEGGEGEDEAKKGLLSEWQLLLGRYSILVPTPADTLNALWRGVLKDVHL